MLADLENASRGIQPAQQWELSEAHAFIFYDVKQDSKRSCRPMTSLAQAQVRQHETVTATPAERP